MDDLELAVDTLQSKNIAYAPLFDYYSGDQPIRYAAERLRDIFENKQTRFTQNWCMVVVNAVCDRLRLMRWNVQDDEALSDQLNLLWRSSGLTADMEAADRAVAITGEAFVLAWPGETGAEAFYHDPRICNVWYDPENPRKKRMAAKWWNDDSEVWWLNLYYPDRILHYRADAGNTIKASSFLLVSEEVNTAGRVPIFHLYRDRHILQGELTSVIPLQDAINKLLADMMIAAEFGAFRQRWIITNTDTTKLKNNPNGVWELPGAAPGEQPTEFGEFEAAELTNYLSAIDRLAASIGIITQTPRHYFYAQGGDPSGEALIAMESPLTRKVQQYQARLGDGWADVAAFMLSIDGVEIDALDISPVWADAETVQPRTEAEIRQMDVASGIPLVTSLRWSGWTDAELEQLAVDREAEQVAQQAQLASAMVQAQRSFDQNAGPGVGSVNET